MTGLTPTTGRGSNCWQRNRILSPARLPFRQFAASTQISVVQAIIGVNPALRGVTRGGEPSFERRLWTRAQAFINSMSLVTVRLLPLVLVLASLESK